MTTTSPEAQNGQAPAAPAVPALNFVEPSAAPPTQNFLLYGPPGSGKSTGAASAPGPIIWLNAEGENALRFPRERFPDKEIRELAMVGAKTLDELFLYLRAGGQDEKTLVVDSIGELYRILLEELSGGRTPQIQHYGDVNAKLERFSRSLRDLPINVVLLAHEEVADVEGVPTRRPITGGKKLPEQIMAHVDHVGYTGVIPPSDKNPNPQYVAQLVETHGRRAKSRGGRLGPVREVNLTEWIDVVTGANQKEGQQ